jgi:hypothetical protein
MPYQLGQYVQAHNRRQRARGALVPAAAGAVKYVYDRLPSLAGSSEQKIVAAAVRASHELKNLDVSQTFGALNSTYQAFLLNAITQGPGATQRTGRQVHIEGLTLAYTFTLNASQNWDVIRVLVVYDKECRGGALQQADVMSNNSTQIQAINTGYDMDNVPVRFKILHDATHEVHSFFSATSQVQTHKYKLQSKLRTHFYNTTVGTIVDIDAGSLYLMVFGLNATLTSAFSFDTRVMFRDV